MSPQTQIAAWPYDVEMEDIFIQSCELCLGFCYRGKSLHTNQVDHMASVYLWFQ